VLLPSIVHECIALGASSATLVSAGSSVGIALHGVREMQSSV
jgi:hypothetical protein